MLCNRVLQDQIWKEEDPVVVVIESAGERQSSVVGRMNPLEIFDLEYGREACHGFKGSRLLP